MTATQIRHLVLAAAVTGAGCSGDAEPADEAGPAGGAITVWTDSTELFMEHPALIVGEAGRFNVHLTDLTDFAPLRSGRIVLRFVPRASGEPVVVTQDQPRAPGIFGPAPVFARPGTYDLTLIVESPQARDSMVIPALEVYARADDAPREEAGADAGVGFLKEQQWKTPGFRTVFAESGSVVETFGASGEIEPASGRLADLRAPVAALVDLADAANAPVEGQRVSRGQVLGHLRPSLESGGSAVASARAELREAEDEHARARRLVEAQAVPARRLHEAEIRLQAAREALAGLGAGALSADGRLPIVAPIAGVIVRRSLVHGSRVDAGASLFLVVDPSVVWLRAAIPADRAPQLSSGAGAFFTIAGDERLHRAARVVSIGSVIDSLSRTLPVIYEVANPDGTIRIGSAAVVQVRTGRRAAGVVIPDSAVLDEDGRPIAYVQTGGELFEKRVLVAGGRDGTRFLVREGIAPGERVVSGAAYQVRLASLSTAVPAHGHEH